MRLPQFVDAWYPGPKTWTPTDVLKGARVTSSRVDLLDLDDVQIDILDGVQPGWSVKETSTASVHGAGQLSVVDTGQGVDWRNVRLRPVLIMTDPSGNVTEYPQGVYKPALPKSPWTDLGRVWTVELTDKLGILDTTFPLDDDLQPVTYGAPAGTNVIDAVRAILTNAGLSVDGIQPGDETLNAALVEDIGTMSLKIVNDLLNMAGYFSLWCDELGRYRVTNYVTPASRMPIYGDLNPFTDGESSLMQADFEVTQDIYDVPNYVLCTSMGDGDSPGMESVVMGDGPPWQMAVYLDQEATSQAALDAQAQMLYSQAASVTASVTVNHLYLPDLHMNSTVNFRTSDRYGDYDMLCYVSSTERKDDGTCQTTLQQAVI